ncbi:hypothetical protein NQ314_000439 [Rhamnusium bicolor]|uniref:Uncharacterized protein n=1 Tax=Rhamnusium bicolor TaxID=1586634 RepID=A0AAV8ZVE8_9CUCU|nr:hypothetical protein NQ314_000439 [Rhamnusium bicolor]
MRKQNQGSRLNKVADLNSGPLEFGTSNGNNNIVKRPISVSRNVVSGTENNNRNRMVKVGIPQPQVS